MKDRILGGSLDPILKPFGALFKKVRGPHPALTLLAFFVYSAVIIYMEIKHHVFWRDEVRALSIAKQADSFSNLMELLRNEGHPPGWYILLKAVYSVFHANWVLPVVSIGVAIVAIFIWLQFAPFSLFERVLFLTGVFPLYEFSVLARNYGISMLLMFWFCTQFDKRLTRPALTYLPLFFLSFTNAHSAMMTAIVTGALVLELLYRRTKRFVDYVPAALVLMGTAWVVWMLHSRTTSSIVFSAGNLSVSALVGAVVNFVLHPGHALISDFDWLSPWHNWLLRILVLIGFALGLVRRPILLMVFLVTACAMSCFSDLVYGLQYRHQGLLYIFWLCCVWIDREMRQSREVDTGKQFWIGGLTMLPPVRCSFSWLGRRSGAWRRCKAVGESKQLRGSFG